MGAGATAWTTPRCRSPSDGALNEYEKVLAYKQSDLYGLAMFKSAWCLWRMGQLPQAQQVFERILSLNPNDNQGARFCRDDVGSGRSWDEMQASEARRA